MNNQSQVGQTRWQFPAGFFTGSSLGTLSGATALASLVTGTLRYIFGLEQQDAAVRVIGLLVSIAVVYLAVFLTGTKQKKQYVIALLNGFVVFTTMTGLMAYTPYVNPNTGPVDATGKTSLSKEGQRPQFLATVFRPLVRDRNLVSKYEEKRDTVGILHQEIQVRDNLVQTAAERTIRNTNERTAFLGELKLAERNEDLEESLRRIRTLEPARITREGMRTIDKPIQP